VVGRVLVVEDNERLQQLLRLQFQRRRRSGDVSSPMGLQAVEAAEDGYDLINFMDCLMPNMDGLAATKAIRERERHTRRSRPYCRNDRQRVRRGPGRVHGGRHDDYLAQASGPAGGYPENDRALVARSASQG